MLKNITSRNIQLIQFPIAQYLQHIQKQNLFTRPAIPNLDKNQWWGPGLPSPVDTTVHDFKLNIPDEELADLKWRLERVRPLVPPLEGIQQQYGMNTKLLQNVLDHWRNKYNWREREVFLNKFPQFKVNIQGLDIHYLHIKPKNVGSKKVLPLLMIHGWPGSVREFYDVAPILTDSKLHDDFAIELIMPHIPGYGFSQAPSKPGCGAAQMAVIFKNFMSQLGFEKFYGQGGDFGAIILQHLSVLFPESVLGFHTNMAMVYTRKAYWKKIFATLTPSMIVKPEHKKRVYPLKTKMENTLRETGYLHLQATKPDTLGVGLNESPVGLAAYILEKFTTGTNITYQSREDGGLTECFAYDDLLDNVMIYWWTRSATTSFRLYSETFNKAHWGLGILRQPVKVPTSIARFRFDFYTPDGLLKEIYPNLVQLTDYEGGHFAAFQLPEIFSKDVVLALEKFEKLNKNK